MTTMKRRRPVTAMVPAPPPEPPVADRLMPLVRVNLLPAEVITARQGHRTRRIVLVALVVLALVLGAGSFVVRASVGAARDELASTEAVSSSLRAQQGRYGEVVTVQADLAAVQATLASLTSTDIAWATVLAGVGGATPAGVGLAGVQGSAAQAPGTPAAGNQAPGIQDSGAAGGAGGAAGGAGTTAAGATGTAAAATAAPTPVVSLTLVGAAPDPAAVAAYVDALTRLAFLTDVVATGVTALPTGGYAFGITVTVTTAALVDHGAATTTGGR